MLGEMGEELEETEAKEKNEPKLEEKRVGGQGAKEIRRYSEQEQREEVDTRRQV